MKTPAQELGEAITADLQDYPHISQESIATALQVTQQAVSGWKIGKSMPRGWRLAHLAEQFPPESRTRKFIRSMRNRYVHGIDSTVFEGMEYAEFVAGQAMSAEEKQVDYPEGRRVPAARARKTREQSGPSGPPPPTPGEFDEPRPIEFAQPRVVWSRGGPDSDLDEVLRRAAKGVDLARQVLDDASVQLARAIEQIKK